MLKKAVEIVFIVLLLMNNVFAVAVSDNDGAAFITKAEFDSLKNNFQSQIDQYNTSIDSKIDNAIASYLSGIKVIKTESKVTLCYTPDGILSPRDSYRDLNFKEGVLRWDIMWYIASGSGTDGRIELTGRTSSDDSYDFNELGINNIEQVGGKWVASWEGYVQDKQYLRQTCQHWAPGEGFQAWVSTPKLQHNTLGILPLNNVRLNTYVTPTTFMAVSLNCFNPDPWGTWGFRSIHNTATRTISNTINENIIITPNSVVCKRFSRLDDVYDFTNCTDPDTTTFRKLSDGTSANLTELFASGVLNWGIGYYGSSITTTQSNKTITFKSGKSGGNNRYYMTWSDDYTPNWYTTKPTGWDAKFSWQPYFGFCNYYTDYNQLYTNAYDNMIDVMKESQSDLNVIADADGVEHLAINAGSPIVVVDNNDEVTIEIEFDDKTKDYDCWFKIGSFSYDKSPKDENDLIAVGDIKVDGTVAENGLADKSFKIKNGKGKAVVTIPKKGYLFFKWQYANSNIEGGGTYLPSNLVIVQHNN